MNNRVSDSFLHAAVRSGNIEQVQALLRNGNDVDLKNRFGQTPLMEAARRGHMDIARLLIDAGTNVDARESAIPLEDGRHTALAFACERSGKTGYQIAEILLAAGANPNLASTCFAPLDHPCMNGNLDLVRLLLKHGANPNGLDGRISPLAHAAGNAHFNDQIQIVRELISHGADPNRGEPPLCATLSVPMPEELLRCGADVNRRDSEGKNALHHHFRTGSIELITAYIKAGIDVNAKDHGGFYALAYLASHPRIDIAELLVAAGADVNSPTKDGCTLLDYLNERMSEHSPEGCEKKRIVVDFLRGKGAKTGIELNLRSEKKRRTRKPAP